MTDVLQAPEYLYEDYQDMDGQFPSEWKEHLILKKTREFVFLQYRIGRHHETLKLRRHELEEKGEIYWSRGTLVRWLCTAERKNQIDAKRKARFVPECLRFLGLTWDATIMDVRQAYRQEAKNCHPDSGGSDVAFRQLREHYELALRALEGKR